MTIAPTATHPGLSAKPGRDIGRTLIVLTSLWIAVGLASVLQTAMIGLLDVRESLRLAMLEWGPWIAISPFVALLAAKVPITAPNWRWPVLIHVVGGLVVTLAIDAMTSALGSMLLPAPMPGVIVAREFTPVPGTMAGARRVEEPLPGSFTFQLPEGVMPPTADVFQTAPTSGVIARKVWFLHARFTLPLYWLLVAAVHAWRYHQAAFEREHRALVAENQLNAARLQALQSQLHPHFLFNSLNALSALIHTRPTVADEMLCALSDLLRSILATSHRQEVSLREELAFAERYVTIHRIRFGQALRVEWKIAPQAFDAQVPTLILQPLIENAVAHGLGERPGALEVSAGVREDRLLVAVADRPAVARENPAPTSTREGVGIRNTRSRLETLYGVHHRFELVRTPEGMRAEIELPLRKVST